MAGVVGVSTVPGSLGLVSQGLTQKTLDFLSEPLEPVVSVVIFTWKPCCACGVPVKASV